MESVIIIEGIKYIDFAPLNQKLLKKTFYNYFNLFIIFGTINKYDKGFSPVIICPCELLEFDSTLRSIDQIKLHIKKIIKSAGINPEKVSITIISVDNYLSTLKSSN